MSIENVIGSNELDNLIGDDNDNSLLGGGGADVFGSSGGVDAFIGGTGNDIFQVIHTENPNSVTYDGGGDTDTITAFFGSWNLFEFTGNTTLTDVETLVLSGVSANSTVLLSKSNFIAGLDRITVNSHDGFAIRLKIFLSDAEQDLSGVTFEGFDHRATCSLLLLSGVDHVTSQRHRWTMGSRPLAAMIQSVRAMARTRSRRKVAMTSFMRASPAVIPASLTLSTVATVQTRISRLIAAGTNVHFVDDGGPAGDHDIVDLSGSSNGFSMFGVGLVTAATGARVEYTDNDLLILTDFSDTVQAVRIGDLAEGVDLGTGNDRFTDFDGALLPGQTVDGGAGIDTVSSQQGLAVDVELVTNSGLPGFERLVGSIEDDRLIRDATADTTILGRSGDDTISGGGGIDTVRTSGSFSDNVIYDLASAPLALTWIRRLMA